MKISSAQLRVLERIWQEGGGISAQLFNDLLGGDGRRIRAMFSHGWVSGDAIPATWISLTEAGRDALAINEA